MIFSAAFPEVDGAGTIAVIALAVVGLVYSAMGGLRASLRTDVMQNAGVPCGVCHCICCSGDRRRLFNAGLSWRPKVSTTKVSSRLGLGVVALLQVISYPVHDPVMMDRGFIADEKTTRRSFFHAFWISSVCIFGFGMFGIQAALIGAEYDINYWVLGSRCLARRSIS